MSLPRRPLRVGLLHNPLSGRNRGAATLRGVLAGTRDLPHRAAHTPAEIAHALGAFATEGVECLVVSGGDGTVQAVLTVLHRDRLFEAPPLLAVLPSGTANMIAGDVGLRGARARALCRLLTWARDPERRPAVVDRAVLRVQAAPHVEPMFGMFFGTGAIYHGIRYCRAWIYPLGVRGRSGAALTLLRYLLALVARRRMPTVAVTSAVDGEPAVKSDQLFVLVTTLERLLLGLRPFWGVGEGALRLTGVAARPRHLLRALPSVLRGCPSRHGMAEGGYTSRNAREVRLLLDAGCTLDGELFTPESRHGPVLLADGGRARFVQC